MRLFLILLFLTACVTQEKLPQQVSSESRRPSENKKDTRQILRFAKNSSLKDRSRWTISRAEISFSGTLVKGDCQVFERSVENQTILRVNSSGGDAFEGLCIAREMLRRNFSKTVVTGICVSSCANYLFLASPNREIEYGIVGFHGNISALLKRDPQNISLKKQLAETQISKEEANKVAQTFARDQLKNAALEQEFLKKIGVSQELFEITQEPDKGAHDGEEYSFLLPTSLTFEKYGIHHVTGSQHFELGQAMGMNNLVH